MSSNIIDVVMPVYNAAPYLKESIESILSQSFENFGFIIIDDGSSDGSRDILQEYKKKDARIKLLRNDTNSGICVSLNKAFAESNAKYIVRMDADDISHKDRIQTQLNFMETHPNIGVCGCNMQCITVAGQHTNIIKDYYRSDKKIRKSLFLFNPISHSGAIIRKDIFSKVGGYDNDFIFAEDLDLRFRMGQHSKFANITKILLEYRIYTENSTHKNSRLMMKNAIKTRIKAITKYGYKPGLIGLLAIATYFFMQPLPPRVLSLLFYKLRRLIF